MRAIAVRQSRRHRVAVATPGTAHPLQIAGLIGRHGTQQHRGQATDIHPHLQRRGGRQQVLVPGFGRLVLEAGL